MHNQSYSNSSRSGAGGLFPPLTEMLSLKHSASCCNVKIKKLLKSWQSRRVRMTSSWEDCTEGWERMEVFLGVYGKGMTRSRSWQWQNPGAEGCAYGQWDWGMVFSWARRGPCSCSVMPKPFLVFWFQKGVWDRIEFAQWHTMTVECLNCHRGYLVTRRLDLGSDSANPKENAFIPWLSVSSDCTDFIDYIWRCTQWSDEHLNLCFLLCELNTISPWKVRIYSKNP